MEKMRIDWTGFTSAADKAAELARNVSAMVGHDGTADIRTIVDCALSDNPDVTAEEIAEIVREAREDAKGEG